jgi:Zn-dependent protease with chaperone function
MGFVTRSLLVLMFLYGIVFVLGDIALLHANAPLIWGVAFVFALVGIQYAVSPWIIEWIYSIGWYEEDIPQAQRDFIRQLCEQRGIPMPRMGIIESGTPNAFAFGRVRSDARIVVTRGLLDICTPEEANAVLAHELGHIAHYDFAVMALAATAPLLLYQIYAWTSRLNNQGRIVSYAAYLAYWIGQFMVLLLNRTREYGADHFSAQVTGEPDMLSSALVKIGYGMVRERGEQRRQMLEGSNDEKKDARRRLQAGQALGLMGIASATGSDALALASNDPAAAARVMQWDLVNPWSRVYELSSTHPLTAMRLRALNREAAKLGQQPAYPLPEKTRVRWAGFPVEFLFWIAPLACGFLLISWMWIGRPLEKLGVELPDHALAWVMLTLGVTWAAKIAFRYHGRFVPKKVQELLEDLGVSQMRPRAVEMEGEVVGNGVPGAFWSPDLVLQDETGLMFLYYRSSVPLGRLFFAVRSADRFIGERVKVKGWYRRGIKPYIELARIEATVNKPAQGSGMTSLFGKDGASASLEYEQLVERSYSRWIQLAAAAVCAAIGVIWLMN